VASGPESEATGRERLKSWKEIASYFEVDERTAKRWEAGRGLPVHRLPGTQRAGVFAYRDELDAWLRQRSAADSSLVEPAELPHEEPPRRSRSWVPFAIGLLAFGAVGAFVYTRQDLMPAAPAISSNPAAESAYLSGVYQLSTRSAGGIDRALKELTRATRLDPGFAPAAASLGEAYAMAGQYGRLPPDQSYRMAETWARRALALDSRSARAEAVLGFARFYGARDFPSSKAAFQRALALAPDDARVHQWYALVLMHGGDQRTALAEIEDALRHTPTDRAIVANRGLILFHAGRTAEAVALLRDLAAAESQFVSPHAHLATILLATGQDVPFLAEFDQQAALARSPDLATVAAAARRGFATGGRAGMLRAMAEARRALLAAGRGSAFEVALAEARLGSRDAALRWLDIALTRGEPATVGLLLEPALAPLKTDPRFTPLVARAGLPPVS
jgi:tetratricopeptide (TPR) repeat protein